MGARETHTNTRYLRVRAWPPGVLINAVLLLATGIWVWVVTLIGPTIHLRLGTGDWRFSGTHWELLLLPGLAVFIGGLSMLVPSRGLAWLGGLLATAGGVWLLAGPVVRPIWASTALNPTGTVGHMAILRLVYFIVPGAVAVYFAAYAQGLVARRGTRVVNEQRVVTEQVVTDPETHQHGHGSVAT